MQCSKIINKSMDADIRICHVPGRKKAALCVRRGNVLNAYAYFTNEKAAEDFMEILAQICVIKEETE